MSPKESSEVMDAIEVEIDAILRDRKKKQGHGLTLIVGRNTPTEGSKTTQNRTVSD